MITYKVRNISKVNSRLKRFKSVLNKDPRLLEDIGNIVVRDIKKMFAEGGDPKWKPSNRARKLRMVKSGKRKGEKVRGKTLMQTSQLRNSIKHQVKGKKVTVGALKTTKGGKVNIAAVLHHGVSFMHPGGTPYMTTAEGIVFMKKDGSYPKSVKFTKRHAIKIPPRPFLFVSDRAAKLVMRSMNKALKAADAK